MTEVYLVTSGCYSDYQVNRVFTTAELAEAYVSTRAPGSHAFDNWNIETWTLTDRPVGRRTWHSAAWSCNEPPGSEFWYSHDYDDDELPPHADKDLEKRWSKPANQWQASRLTVEGWDKERVAKVLGEEKARYLAEQEGLT